MKKKINNLIAAMDNAEAWSFADPTNRRRPFERSALFNTFGSLPPSSRLDDPAGVQQPASEGADMPHTARVRIAVEDPVAVIAGSLVGALGRGPGRPLSRQRTVLPLTPSSPVSMNLDRHGGRWVNTAPWVASTRCCSGRR